MIAIPLLLAAITAAEPGSASPLAPPAAPPASEAGIAPNRAGPAADLAALVARADAAWAVRDQPGQLEALAAALAAAATLAPGHYEVLWRQARHLGWLAEEPRLAAAEKSRLGQRVWELGDQAAALEPGRIEGHFFAMSGVGNYALGIGVISALTKGIERKFRDRLSRAEAINPDFEGGLIQMSWGRFYFELPWPKHDARLSEKYLRQAIAYNGENVRAHVYLGDLLLDEGRREEARQSYQRAIDIVPALPDPPEQRRWQAVAREAIARLPRK
jgi:tetratricopeptide (TPR) repeat protein